MTPFPALVPAFPALVTLFPSILFNNMSAINGIVPNSCLFSVSLTHFPKIPPNNEEAISAINEATVGAINEATTLRSCFSISSFIVSVTPSINRPGFF